MQEQQKEHPNNTSQNNSSFYYKYFGKYFSILERAYPYPLKIARIGLKSLGVFIALLFVLYLALVFGAWGGIPSSKTLKEIENATASEVFSADSVLLGKYFIENRTNAKYEDLPPYLIQALVSTEDARFYEHGGIDFMSFLRVIFVTIILNDDSGGGGSTISQQLAKNIYDRAGGSLSMPAIKMREMIIAGKLERIYSKEEILTLYFNTVPFGENCYGIEAGALRFFNKKPTQLKIEEAAVLVGLLKANTTYNPKKHPENSFNRRNVVLHQMLTYQNITSQEYDSLKQIPLTINYNNDTQSDGPASYFREYLRIELEKISKDVFPKKEDGTDYNIYTDGLKIYTTIDSKMQKYAEEAVEEQMKVLQKTFFKEWGKKEPWGKSTSVITNAMKRSDRYLSLKKQGYSEKKITEIFQEKTELKIFTWQGEKDTMLSPLDSVKNSLRYLRTGFLAMEPSSGNIKAWVGGIDNNFYKYDHVKSKRQVGSTFKPIVYGAAMEYDSLTPCSYIANQKITYSQYQNWSPDNSGGEYGGLYSLKGGLTYSVNTIAAALIVQTGPSKVIELAKNMGITSKIPNVPSIALGSADISLIDMVTAYCAIDNRGMAIKPQYLLQVNSSKGDTIYVAPKQKKVRAFSAKTADYLINMMQSVVNTGTASRLRGTYGLGMQLAGKTGTTQNNTDGWFIGFSPKLVAGAWVGCEDPAIHFKSTGNGQGASTALPIFGKFMGKVVKDKSISRTVSGSFSYLSDSTFSHIDCPLWVEDTVQTDSMRFLNKVLIDIKNFADSLLQQDDSIKTEPMHLPGAESN